MLSKISNKKYKNFQMNKIKDKINSNNTIKNYNN